MPLPSQKLWAADQGLLHLAEPPLLQIFSLQYLFRGLSAFLWLLLAAEATPDLLPLTELMPFPAPHSLRKPAKQQIEKVFMDAIRKCAHASNPLNRSATGSRIALQRFVKLHQSVSERKKYWASTEGRVQD